jgi:site-specific recombinase XerD
MTTLPTNSITTLLSHCKIALISQKLSLTSRKLYLADIKRFLSWLPKSKLTPSKLSDPKIYHNYLEYLKKQEISPSMMRRTTASLRQLGKIINSMYNLGNPTSSLSPTRRHTDTPTHRHADTPAHWKYIKHFTNYLTLQHLSPSTIKSYKSDISRYITWVHDQGVSRTGKELLTQKNINKYLKYLANSTDYPASTRTRKQASINRFQAWYLDSYGSDLTPDKKLKGLSLGFKGRSLTGDLAKGQVGTAKLEGASLKGFHFKSYLSLGLITLLILSLGYFGFQAFSRDQVLLSQAYPSTPVGPNRQLSFQGRLEDSGGTPITSSTNLVFKLFDASTVGSELYSTGTCAITPDTDGVFSTQIGSSCGSGIGSDVFSENADVWLEVTVGAETLTPRQQIATVAYALNSETLQGIPLSSTMSAIANSIVPMNSYGEIIIGEQSPRMTAVSGTFAISAPALSLTTTTGSSGNISIAPDGTGQVNVTGNTTSTNFFNVTNAQLTTGSLLTGTVANSNTGYLLLDLLSGSSPTSKFSVADDGDTTLAGDLTITGDDLFMTTNTAGMLLVADGTNYNPTAISGDITINGSGATVIGADKILESHLKAVDTASDEECLTYEVTTGDFEWQSCGAGGITSFTAAGDTGGGQAITDSNTLSILGGTNGIDTIDSTTDTITLNLDTTEIGTTTFGAGAGITWTYDASAGTDTTIGFGNNTQTYTTGTGTFTGNLVVQGTTGLTFNTGAGGDITFANGEKIDNDTDGTLALTSPMTTVSGDLTITGDDLFMTTNTAGMLLIADGTSYNPTTVTGDITINGSGATVIGADKILESHLKAVDTASDEECLTYEVTTGDFEWQSCGGGGAAGSWQESLGAISPNNSTWDLLIGGTATSSAKIAFTNINSGTPTIRSADATALNITGNAASTWNTTAGDLTLSADAASVNINANEAAANQIDLTASGTVAGDAININTADGGIILNAAGASNGDVTLTSADDTVVTATGLLSLTGGAGSLIDFSTFDINSSGIISMIDSVAHTIEDVGGNLTLTSAASAAVSIVNDLYVSSGISTFGTAVSDGTVEATKFCTGDGETNCVTDFSTLGGGLFTDGGTYVYPTSGETLGNSASAGANKIAGLYLADSAPLTFGNDNDIDFTFAGSELATTLGSNTWNINSNLLFLNGSTSRIGIGTGSPLATLDIRSTLGTIPTASISGNTSMASLIVDQSGTGDIFAASSSGETRFVVASDGNVGIGVQDPSSKLEIGGSTSTISNDSGDITINAASNFISLAGDSLGNLLDLSVAGDASVSGVLSFDGLSPSSINALNGNEFTFRTSVGGDTGLTTAMTIHNSGNIGLLADSYINWGATEGTSGYGFRDNSGTIQYKNSGGAWGNIGGGGAAGMWQENTGAISQLNNTWDVLIGSTATSSALVKFPGITGGDVIFNAGGNVGIGTTAPGEELEVVGDVGAQRFVDTASATYYLDPAATGTSLIVDGNMISNGAFSITSNGTNGNITIDAGTGTVVIGSSGTGKLDAGTIDPPYTINGDKFATYLSGMTGVKEETTGSVQTTEHIPGYGYRAAIDLASAPQGSDLWLFREVTNLHEQFDELVVLLSANSNTRTWYELVPESGLIQIYSSAPSTISYRLTAPRFDAETWANTRDGSDALGFILEGQTNWDTSSQPPEAPTTNPFAEIFHSITTTIAQITSLETNLISPLDSTQPLTIAANTIITPGDPSLPTLTIDGEIQASSISARIARLEELDVDTLRANNIIANSITANSIEGLDAKIASLSAGSTTELSDDDLETITDRIKARLADLTDTTAQDISTPPEATFSASSIPLSENEENYSTGTDSATLASLDADMVFINDYLAVIGQAVITNLDITGYFYTDSITSKSNTLALQPTGGLVNLANNTLIVDSSGQVAINGDLTVSGKILAQSAQLGSLELGTPPATPSSQLGQLLAVYNESGEAVATIDASGSASFRDLSTRLITIAAPSDATESASTSALAQALGISSTSNATAGEATLVSPNTELIIESEYVSDNTLVYLTPTTNTDNKVVFVKAKETCPPPPPDVSVVLTPCTRSFTVAVDSPAATDISFNWWIIKLESQQ